MVDPRDKSWKALVWQIDLMKAHLIVKHGPQIKEKWLKQREQTESEEIDPYGRY